MSDTTENKKDSRKKLYWIIGGVAFILTLVGIYIYHQGKKTVTIAPLPKDDSSTLSDTSDGQISEIASDMFNDLDEYDIFASHDPHPYNDALSLSDLAFVKLYNFYNTKYQNDDGGKTLTMKIQAQNSIPYSSWESIQAGMLKRLGKLNLR